MTRWLRILYLGSLLILLTGTPMRRAHAAGPTRGRAEAPRPRFIDATAALGLRGLNGSKAAWGDFDGDGWPDLYAAGQLWRNAAGKRFERIEKARPRGAGVWGDFDNDGRRDLFCWSGGPKLYRNLGANGFEDVSARLPKCPIQDSRGGIWCDLDGDGLLDLYVGGYERPGYQFDVVYRNAGKGGFELTWQTPERMPARGLAAADYDEDGDIDIYVSNYRLARNLLWRNDGKGGLTDVAAAAGVAGNGELGAWGHTIGSAFGDLDDDGHLDLFAGNFSHRPTYQDRPKFYRNRGPEHGWAFEDMSAKAGLAWQESFASPALADADNDGDLDLLFSTVYPGDHCVLYRNDGGWRFTDVTKSAGVSGENTYQAAWADFDRDGDMDLVMGRRLFRNELTGTHWLELRLVGDGKVVCRDAVGAQARIRLGKRTLMRHVDAATGEGNQSSSALHFGLGGCSDAVVVEILWPDGATQTVTTQVDRVVTVAYRPRQNAALRPARSHARMHRNGASSRPSTKAATTVLRTADVKQACCCSGTTGLRLPLAGCNLYWGTFINSPFFSADWCAATPGSPLESRRGACSLRSP